MTQMTTDAPASIRSHMSTNATSAREQRLAAGLSQQRLAELARCSLNMVRLLEAGYEPTSSRVAPRVAKVLERSHAAARERA